jgi:hypothetical protein
MSKRVKFANIVLGSMAIFFLSLFVFALARINFYPRREVNIYYIFSIAGFFIYAFVLLKCDAELKVKISLITLSVMLSLYAMELLLSYNKTIKPEQIRAKLAKDSGIPYDSRHRTELWQEFRNKGVEAYPLYNPYDNMEFKDSKLLPLGYLSGKTVISCNESGEFVIYKTDEHGLNNPEGLYDEGKVDYVLIGDSFAQGACVARDENIAGRLMNKGRNVLNLGMLNSGPPKELAILKEYAAPLKPKVIFWLFYEGNDHEGLEFEKKSSLIMQYLDKDFSQGLINRQDEIDRLLTEKLEREFANLNKRTQLRTETDNERSEGSFNLSLSSLKLSQLRKRLGMFGDCESKIDPLFKDIMAEAKRIVNGWDGELVFVYLPTYERYAKRINRCRMRFLDTERSGALAVVEELKLPVIDIKSVFDAHPEPLSLFPFKVYGHYNAGGYRLVAESLDKYLSIK